MAVWYRGACKGGVLVGEFWFFHMNCPTIREIVREAVESQDVQICEGQLVCIVDVSHKGLCKNEKRGVNE